MKAIFLVLCLITNVALAASSVVTFLSNTPYSLEERNLVAKELQKLCPTLFDVNHRSTFSEVTTKIERVRYDQNMFDSVYTTRFYYETNEAGRFDGTVTISAMKSYGTTELAGFYLVSDSREACH